jgi:hypothetical protein
MLCSNDTSTHIHAFIYILGLAKGRQHLSVNVAEPSTAMKLGPGNWSYVNKVSCYLSRTLPHNLRGRVRRSHEGPAVKRI